ATIMVFQAVAEYYKQVKRVQETSLEVEVSVSGRLRPQKWIFTKDTSLVTRSDKVQIRQDINITAKGNGVGSLKVMTLYYARPTEMTSDCRHFNLSVKMQKHQASYPGALESYLLTIETQYNSKTRDATMSILDIGLLTGFVVDERDLRDLTTGSDRYIQKFEMDRQLSERGSLILYLDKVSHGETDRIAFKVHKVLEVAMLQPASISVYEYYSPGDRCVKFYHPKKKSGTLDKLTDKQGLSYCAEGNCSIQKKQKIEDEHRNAKVCEAGLDYVYKVKLVSSQQTPFTDIYNMKIVQVLKEGSDEKVDGLVRSFMGHANCREYYGFEEGKEYLIMGHEGDLVRSNG
ncbi:hypothetical protein NFI96_024606, partial [Prochilodus magdalenae]